MKRLMTLAIPAAALVIAVTHAPAARAFDMAQMEQFAPMIDMMKQRMSKRQFRQMMQMGAAMMPMMERSGFTMSDLGPGLDLGSMTAMTQNLGGMQSFMGMIPRGKVRRKAR
jgi:hypothetical protein